MLNTKIDYSPNIKMPAVCAGSLQRTHQKSKFARFHVRSHTAEWFFDEKPCSDKDRRNRIVVLQAMAFGDSEMLVEYVNLADYSKENR